MKFAITHKNEPCFPATDLAQGFKLVNDFLGLLKIVVQIAGLALDDIKRSVMHERRIKFVL